MKELLLYIKLVLFNKTFMWLLFIVNLLGTVYGFYWYKGQLSQTEAKFLLFVPDSPTASLFFTIALFAWLLKKNWKLIEALALITLVKYGLWAVVMNVWTYVENDYLGWMGWMLVASHFAMAVQAVLYIPYYRFTWIHILIAAIWTLHNDVVDYVFDQMPTYRSLNKYADQIGYFTFWLSIACIALASFIYQKRSKRIS
ncbi:DUF1405 domain-containing protein [Psychrobacillus antarcticus]|uniref:DUF1405 domain-containing protein n=1 Tax=Psychrobacillus antarcticus TaxID=2879115 RepID=UPI0024082B49|nr:DUF1405 domain-containing protein [Psychrobacillus antarcticus]